MRKKFLLALFSPLVVAGIVSYGGGGGGSASVSEETAEAQGVAVDDYLANATVEVYSVLGERQRLYNTTTNMTGGFTIRLPIRYATQPILLRVHGGLLYNGSAYNGQFNGVLYTLLPPGWDAEDNLYVVSPIQTVALLATLNINNPDNTTQVVEALQHHAENINDISQILQQQ